MCMCISHLSLSSLAFWFTSPRRTRCLDCWANTNANFIFPKPSLHVDICQSREHYFVIPFSEMLLAHCWVLLGIPMSTLGFHKVNPFLSSFSFLQFISPFKRYRVERYTFCFTWLIVTTKNNAFILYFQISDLQSEANSSKQKSDPWPWLTRTQTLLSLCGLFMFWKSAIFPFFKNS